MAEPTTNTRNLLNDFGAQVVKAARLELAAKQPRKVYRAKWKNGKLVSYQTRVRRYRSNNTKELSNSLNFEVKEVLGNLIVVFSAEEYWYYVNFGREKGKGVPFKIIDEWIRTKPIKPQDFGTDESGKLYTKGFKKMTKTNLKSMRFLINRKIKTFGIEGNNFWTKSFEFTLESLRDQLGSKIAKDLANLIQNQISA